MPADAVNYDKCIKETKMAIKKARQGKPSRARIIRAVATSTAIETGQSPDQLETTLKKRGIRSKFSGLALAV
jgi:hypothetical protein